MLILGRQRDDSYLLPSFLTLAAAIPALSMILTQATRHWSVLAAVCIVADFGRLPMRDQAALAAVDGLKAAVTLGEASCGGGGCVSSGVNLTHKG